ncbi:hypothetical protein ElyMa_006338300 [Elysia marginata]|uniref:Uncharacterized protein n=1 Tax=Elysia marginata TaxID=1093978 RepID=A0AAV4HMP8_9GAST|nr:hypothetical protein ElyMa_006338300 [Elysia marginata]
MLETLVLCLLHGEVHSTELGIVSTSASSNDSKPTDPPTSTSTSTPKTTLPPLPPATLGPSTEVKYRLTLTNPGPSVLDSTLAFAAELQTEDGKEIPQGTKFEYQWMTMADQKVHKTKDEFKAKIPLTFPSSGNTSVKAGDYTMTVVASEVKNPSKIVAFQTKKFVLTNRLNGHLQLHQNLEYQRLNNTFAAGKAFSANAVVVDRFTEQETPHYQFFWYEDGKFIITSPDPEVVTTVVKPGNISLKSEILATMAVKGGEKQKDKQLELLTDLKGGKLITNGKVGIFEDQLYFKVVVVVVVVVVTVLAVVVVVVTVVAVVAAVVIVVVAAVVIEVVAVVVVVVVVVVVAVAAAAVVVVVGW